MTEFRKLLSFVIPLYNEEGCLRQMYDRLLEAIAPLVELYDHEIIFVNDGSTDRSLEILRDIAANDPTVRVLSFSRNFGHQSALNAGLDHAGGDAVISMDADLQHPPEMIPKLLAQWEEGNDVVFTIRHEALHVPPFKRMTSKLFYTAFRKLSGLDLDFGAADFRLLDKKVLRELTGLRERNKFMRGLVRWVGFNQKGIPYTVKPRAAGESKYSLLKMIRFAALGIVSFSTVPLRAATLLGFAISGLSSIYLFYVIAARILGFVPTVAGWASTLAAVLLIGGIQLLCLGILGEYIGQIYDEVKARPSYILMEKINFDKD
jgi:glycosyltransferase involved in cell wall biosynthesis